jgi:hypothetical protein
VSTDYPPRRRTFPVRIAETRRRVRNEERKPNKRGFKVFVGEGEPLETRASPAWLNDFYYVTGAPIWFCHGLDGETDMGGAYDLTLGATSGEVAFVMPLEWAISAEAYHSFLVLIDDSDADPANWIYVIAAQIIDRATGDVRIYWPISATPYP